jgi:hypothetical protein
MSDNYHDTLGNAFRVLLEMDMFRTAALMVAEWAQLILKCEQNERHPDATEEQQKQCSKDWAYFVSRLDDWFRGAQIDLTGVEVVSKFAEFTTADFMEFMKAKFTDKSKR